MELAKINLLFLHDEKNNPSSIVKFLNTQVNQIKQAFSLAVSAEMLDDIHMILIKELGSLDALNDFASEIKTNHPHIPIVLIEKETHLNDYKQTLSKLMDAFVSLPINKSEFVNILNNSAAIAKEHLDQIQSDKIKESSLLRTIGMLQQNLFFLLKNGTLILKSPYMEKVLGSIDILDIYRRYRDLHEDIQFDALPNKTFRFVATPSDHEYFDTLVTLEAVDIIEYDPIKEESMLSKEQFYEYIKYKLPSLKIGEQFALCDIRMANQEELEKQYGQAKIIESLHRLMHYVLAHIDDGKISFWFDRSLLFSLGSNFEISKEKIQQLHKQISQSTVSHEIPMRLVITVTHIDHGESINSCLEKISRLQETSHNADSNIYVVSSYDDINDDNQKVTRMLHDLLHDSENTSSLSVTSFYKGLIINNPISNVSLSEDGILNFHTEVVQCLAMSLETHVLLHSPLIANDILCQVKQINMRQKSAKIYQYKTLPTSYRQRKFSRLVPAKHTAITLAIDKVTVTGMVLDISMNSISAFVTNELIHNYDKDTKVIASLNLIMAELQRSETVRINTRIITIIPEDGGYKVILGLESNEESTVFALTEYLRLRKKELLSEIRNLLRVTQ